MKRILVLTAAVFVLGTAGSDAQDLSETVAELEALGLRVELQGGAGPIIPGPAAAAPAGSAVPLVQPDGESQNPIADLWNRFERGLDAMLRRNAVDTHESIVRAVRDSCRLSITEDGQGFQLAFVAVSLGGFVTATFQPTEEFCRQMPQ